MLDLSLRMPHVSLSGCGIMSCFVVSQGRNVFMAQGEIYIGFFFFQICQLIIVVAGPGLVCRYKSGLRSPHHHFPPFGNRGDNIVSKRLHQREEKGKKILQLCYQGLISYLYPVPPCRACTWITFLQTKNRFPRQGYPSKGRLFLLKIIHFYPAK